MSDEIWTVQRLLAWTSDFFVRRGIDSPRLDAEVLLAAALKMQRIDLYVNFETIPDDVARGNFRDWVKRRVAGEPVAYLVGHKEFFSLTFQLTRDTLIPRSETELLVIESLDFLRANPSMKKVCDVGTGSGCIAIALSQHAKNATITATDISRDAIAVARENGKKHGARVEWIESDLLQNLRGEFDLLVSNLPYVSESEYITLVADVKNYEPRTALVGGGQNGTETIARLVKTAPTHLVSGGMILLEHSPMNAAQVASLFADDMWRNVATLPDHNNLPRATRAIKI